MPTQSNPFGSPSTNSPTYGTTSSTGGSGPFSGAQSGLGAFFGVNPTYNTIHADYFDPLYGQGQDMRTGIYNQIAGLFPGMMSNAQGASGAMGQAYALPGWGQAQQLASNEMQGNYLNGSPELDAAMAQMRAGSEAATANTNAGVRSQYAQNGMAFGTGNQEAEAANNAANNASANQAEAQAREQNYQAERQLQSNAVNNYATATTTPLNYLAQDNEPYMTPLTEISQIVSGLSKGGAVNNPDTAVDPGFMKDLFGSIGSI